jgi:hypothetical protein
VPNCYYVVSSEPEGTAKDVQDCADEFGGDVRPIGWGRRKKRYLVLVWLPDDQEVESKVDEIRNCLVRKGHTVHDHDILNGGFNGSESDSTTG